MLAEMRGGRQEMSDASTILFVQLMPFDEIRLHKSFRDAVNSAYRRPLIESVITD